MMCVWFERLKRAGWRSDEQLARYDLLFYGIAIAALWYLFRPYTGIIHDSSIYVGRALADLHPTSIGQQLSFAHDGQSRFTIAPQLFAFLIAHFGPGATAIWLTVIGLALWFIAATFLLSRLFRNRLLFAALLCLCGMPAVYGGDWVFHWAEPFATPRIFAEAASLAAIGMLVSRRFILAFILFLSAFVLHPIMALPAVGVAFVLLCQADRRWLWGGVATFAFLVIGGLAGVPVVSRLLVFPDPAWLAVIKDESRQVLISQWYPANWSLVGCQFETVALALYYAHATSRRIAVAATVTAAVGVAMPLGWPSLLILQAQTWRALWLLSFFASAMLPFVVSELWKRGRIGQAAVALLLAAWAMYSHPVWAGLALVACVGLTALKRQRPIPRWMLWICWACTFSAVEFLLATTVPPAVSLYSVLPDGIYNSLPDSVGFGFQFPILVGLALWIALKWKPNYGTQTRVFVWLGIALLAGIAITHWDRRSKFSRAVEEGAGASSLRALIPSGDIFWLGGYPGDLANAASDHGWLWTGRSSWWDFQQGAGVVFDRNLAIESDRRLQLLRKVGLFISEDDLGSKPLDAVPPPTLTQNDLGLLCAAGGPNWIVAPLRQATPTVRSRASGVWRSPTPAYVWDLPHERMISFDEFLILKCDSLNPGSPTTD